MITYRATDTTNGKFYVGSTLDFNRRKKSHLRQRTSDPFHRALTKRPDSFEWETYEDGSGGRELEQALLDMWFGTEQCYNLNPFAEGGQGPHTSETKLRLSQVHSGKTLTKEHCESLSKALTGREFSPSHKTNLSVALKSTYANGRVHPRGNAGKKLYHNVQTGERKMFMEHPGEGWEAGRG